MAKQAKNLGILTKKRKEVDAMLKEKNKAIDYDVAKNVTERRQQHSKKRIEMNLQDEDKLQKITSALMLELLQICAEDDVPKYIPAIARILDNYQGGINTIRSNAIWLSELISQLTDQMRNFDAGQKNLNVKFDLILEKVLFN